MAKFESKSTTHWNDLAKDYDRIMGNVPQMYDLFAEIVRNIPVDSSRILDLGAGTGNLLQKVRQAYPQAELIALDPAQAMLERLKEKHVDDTQISCIVGSAHAIDLLDNSVDAVISNYALHHLTHTEKKECAKEVMRVLRPGGKFVYGDQHCRQMGGPSDPVWVADMFSLLSDKALHYLHTAGLERMLLQIELMPKFLLADGEMPVTVEYWLSCLEEAGFPTCQVIEMEPAKHMNRIIVATKPVVL
jgi:ubiquinone/menaquinone biosynthesis C-methylase UbiE